jgi:hypothetical protein
MQRSAGIRMPDRMMVGWLPPEAQKKKWTSSKILPTEALLSTNDNASSIMYYTKAHRNCI